MNGEKSIVEMYLRNNAMILSGAWPVWLLHLPIIDVAVGFN